MESGMSVSFIQKGPLWSSGHVKTMPSFAGRDVRPMSPCFRSAGVEATSTATVADLSPWERTTWAGFVPPPPPHPARTTSAASTSRLDESPSLEVEEELLSLEPARVADEAPRGADDAVARDDDGDRVSVQRAAHGPCGPRLADPSCEAAVGVHLSVRHALELGQNALLERGDCAQVDGEVELVPAALEVLVQLSP